MAYSAQMVRPVSSVLRVMEFVSVTMDLSETPGQEEHVLPTTRALYRDLVWKDRIVSMEFVLIAVTLVDVEWEPSVILIAIDVNAFLSMLEMPTFFVFLPIHLLLPAILDVVLKPTASITPNQTNVSVIKDTLEILTDPVLQYRSVIPFNVELMQSVSKDLPLLNAFAQLAITEIPILDVKTLTNVFKEIHVEQVQTALTSSARSNVSVLLEELEILFMHVNHQVLQIEKGADVPSQKLAQEDSSAIEDPVPRETLVEMTPSVLLTTLVWKSTRKQEDSASILATRPFVDPMPTALLTIIALIVSVTNLSLEMLGTLSMGAFLSHLSHLLAHPMRLVEKEQSVDQSMDLTLASILVKMFNAVPMQDVKLMEKDPSVPVSILDWMEIPLTFSTDASLLHAQPMLDVLQMRHVLESLIEETTV